jgi:hypothetical protein
MEIDQQASEMNSLFRALKEQKKRERKESENEQEKRIRSVLTDARMLQAPHKG